MREFAAQGFATVVRLPLKSELARQEALRRFIELETSESPILLFLERISGLTLELKDDDNSRRKALCRGTRTTAGLSGQSGCRFEEVDLADQGHFFLATMRVSHNNLLTAVKRSVEAGQIDETWLDWKEQAWVSIAVRLGDELKTGHMYTFLPMEHAPCVFHGYLNAPFYTKLARLDVSEDVHLNAFLLDRVADLCVETAMHVAHGDYDFASIVTSDILCWDASHVERLKQAFLRRGQVIHQAEVVPVITAGGAQTWAALEDTFAWDDTSLTCLKTKRLARSTTVPFLWTDLGEARTTRIKQLYSHLMARPMSPSEVTLANWVEQLAVDLAQQIKPEEWDGFYEDVATLFAKAPGILNGRGILLDQDGKVRPCGRAAAKDSEPHPTVFFQPVHERVEGQQEFDPDLDVRVPQSLRKYLTYMHPALNWYVQSGSVKRLKPSRVFFEHNSLIQRYETREILQNVADVLSQSPNDLVSQDALHFVFQLHVTIGSIQRPGLAELGLRVPTASGWVKAGQSRFSVAWPDTDGALLERLIAQTKGASEELQSLDRRLLSPPEQWPFHVSNPPTWVDFLRKIGVRDGLWPLAVGSETTEWIGRDIQPAAVARSLKLPAKDVEFWVPTVQVHGQTASYVSTQYLLPQFSRLPGQSEHHAFSDRAKATYACLLLRGLNCWPDEFFAVAIRRPPNKGYSDSFSWPTPLDAFVRLAPWAPLAQPGHREKEEFVPLSQAWHFREDGREGFPGYAPLLPSDARRLIESNELVRNRLLTRGLPVWGEPKDAASLLRFLAEIFASGGVDEAQVAGFRKTYERALGNVARTDAEPFRGGTPLLISRRGRLSILTSRSESGTTRETIYVKDGPVGLAGYLLENLGALVVSAPDGRATLVVGMIKRGFGERVKSVSEVQVGVLADHVAFAPTAEFPLLLGELPWLESFVALAMEFRSSRFDHRTEAIQRRVLNHLARVRLKRALHVGISIDGQETEPPPFMKGAVPVRDDRFPTIVLSGDGPLTWSDLIALAPALAEILHQPSLESGLTVCLLELARRLGSQVRAPIEEEYAEVFRTRPEEVRRLLALTRGLARTILDRLYPVVAHTLGVRTAERLNPHGDGADLGTPEAIRAILMELGTHLPLLPEELLQACTHAESLAHLRDMLGLEYAAFNRTLSELGAPYAPLRNVEGHQQAFNFRIQMHREAILQSLRRLFLPDFDQGVALNRYVELRGLPGLAPDSRWLDECETPSPTQMDAHIDLWLCGLGAGPMADGDDELTSLYEVREHNTRAIQELAAKAHGVLRAWCWHHHIQPPALWESTAGVGLHLAELAGAEGVTDFRPLSQSDILHWLSCTARWPGGMELTIDADALRLTPEDLRAEQDEANTERRRREQERRSIVLNGTRMSADRADFRAIIDYVDRTLSQGFLSAPLRFAGLQPLGGSAQKGEGGGTGGGGGGTHRELTDTQKAGIGLIGELVVYRWLRSKYPTLGDECWRSTYRNAVFGGTEGNDSLGYDFIVKRRSGERFYEVKATSGDTLELELGETEVALASRLARTNRYRILFVRNVLDSSRRTIHMLPNPLSPRGARLFRPIGHGLRYKFSLA